MRLIKVSDAYKEAIGEMIEEFKKDQLENHTNHSPWSIFKNDYHDWEHYKNNLEHLEDKDGFVADSVYFLLDEERNKLIGAVNIRHHLNEHLLYDGGHIGDGIRPSERRKGYGTLIITLALEKCQELGIKKVLITCDENNIGSKKAILNNKGVYENTVVDEDKCNIERYWINL